MASPAVYAVRLTITEAMTDSFGAIRDDAYRTLRRNLWGVPLEVRVFVDLGAVRTVDYMLITVLAEQCLGPVIFEHEDWRLAKDYAAALDSSSRGVPCTH